MPFQAVPRRSTCLVLRGLVDTYIYSKHTGRKLVGTTSLRELIFSCGLLTILL